MCQLKGYSPYVNLDSIIFRTINLSAEPDFTQSVILFQKHAFLELSDSDDSWTKGDIHLYNCIHYLPRFPNDIFQMLLFPLKRNYLTVK